MRPERRSPFGRSEISGIEYSWQATPRLWMALREGYCGCPECMRRTHVGYGRTKEDAAADLLEQEHSADSYSASVK